MKILDIILKVVLTLILLMPIAGSTGILGEATREYYNTDQAWAFIQMLVEVATYINYMMVAVLLVALGALWTKREALAALLIAPITANIVGFHLFLDGGLFTVGAVIADILLLLNIYFLWKYRAAYRDLLRGSTVPQGVNA